MPFKIGSISGENIKIGNQQIAKVMLGLTKIWENWVAWSNTIGSTASQGWYGPVWDMSYTIPANVQVTSISCSAGVYNHTSSEIAGVIPRIYVNGTRVANGNGADARSGQWAYSSVSYTPSVPLTSGTVIKVSSEGTSFRRSVTGVFTGLSKGN